ncbi:MAG: pyridoxamine 5'-phosphate oxidase [Bacteroidetes bacterium HGW-Bacteroidetes-17]|jgi:pyridoxamine 5'-phosphate oxidase|nr:MAG: pyridoxamine 5'-phosphate oxidase [Bacteroidetes bacterium HGW-Bacteroidetes-17]
MEEVNRLHGIRREYEKSSLDEHLMDQNPLNEFRVWLGSAIKLIEDDATAMVLSTVSPQGRPSTRIVLLKDISDNGLVFFSNYKSRKGQELEGNAFASLLFYWKEQERQIRIEGKISRTNPEISDEYFNGRPYDSQIAAISSQQSQPIKERSMLEKKFEQIKAETLGKSLKRPEHWGGYILKPDLFEFWQGRPNRLHDRIVYKLDGIHWKKIRLSP